MTPAEAVAIEQAAVDAALAETPVHLASVLDPTMRVLPQHALMGYEIAEWSGTPDGRLTLSAPPRIGKSFTCMIWSPVWRLANHPSIEIIIACASDSLVTQHGTAIRGIIRDHGDVLGIRPVRGSNRSDYVETTDGGKLKLVGIDAQTTGFGADDLYIDDAFRGWDDAHSPRIADKRAKWLQSVALARLYPGGRVLHTGTRWSKLDIHAQAERLGWRQIRIPAIADAPDDPLGRRIGDPLGTPFRPDETPDAALERWRRIRDGEPDGEGGRRGGLDAVIWGTMYQGVPSDQQSMLIPDAAIAAQTWPSLPDGLGIVDTVVQVDPSTGDGRDDNDTCGIVVAHLGDDGRLWITGDHTDRYPVEGWSRRVLEVAAAADASRIRVEANQGGEALRVVLMRLAADLESRTTGAVRWRNNVRPTIEMHHARGSKWSRAAENGLAGLIKTDAVRLVGHLPRLVNELRTFTPGDESPGALDAAAHAALDLLGSPLDRADSSAVGPSVDDY